MYKSILSPTKLFFIKIQILKEPDKVAKISACIPLVNKPKKIKGIGITNGTRETSKK